MTSALDHARSAPPAPHLGELFLAFAKISVSALGGALPWARYVLVERRGWLTPDGFTRTLALCQFLPGPNIVNLCIAVGAQLRGPWGACISLLGLVLPAFAIVLGFGELYLRYGHLNGLRGTFAGIAAGAAGLIVAMTVKVARPLLAERPLATLPFMLMAFIAVGLLRWPLVWVLLALAPLSIALTGRTER
ncbi:chromate transporter [Methylobacterium sp. NPDC080182]|uniref:chromate transporter n=1 Tax=Methylobacterium sp. NPDC080182 TaxID=3390590 RepID=UPI003CFEB475